MLPTRLKPLLPKIISSVHLAFVAQRQITDHIINAHEIIYTTWLTKQNLSFMAIKIDKGKAFDRINWHCVLSMGTNLWFHPN